MERRKSLFSVLIMALLILFNPFIHTDTVKAMTTVFDTESLKSAINSNESEITIGASFYLTEEIILEGKSIVINGDGKTITATDDISNQMFIVSGNSNIEFKNITLNGDGKTSGIWQNNSNLTLNNVSMENFISTGNLEEHSLSNGGAINSLDSNLIVTNSTFTSTASGKVAFAGGFINISGQKANSTITESTFTGLGQGDTLSMATHGGAICFETGIGGTHTIDSCKFTDLSATDTGGAISIGTRKNELYYQKRDENGNDIRISPDSSGNVTIIKSKIENTQTLSSDEAQGGGGIYVGPGNSLTINETKISNGISYEGGLIYNAGNTLITSDTKVVSFVTGGTARKLGGAIYNNGQLALDKALVYGTFVGTELGEVNPHPDKSNEYGGVNIYAEKDVTITSNASFSRLNDRKDIRVIDGQSKIILTGPPMITFNVSISETNLNSGDFSEDAYRKVGYLIASSDGKYQLTAEDAKKIHYLSKDELSKYTSINSTIAKWNDHTSIGKWDCVLNPERNEIVLGQRGEITYHLNGEGAQFPTDGMKEAKSVNFEIYKSDTVKIENSIEDPVRENFKFIGWYEEPKNIDYSIENLQNMPSENTFNEYKVDFNALEIGGNDPQTTIYNPNKFNVYAGWLGNGKVIYKFSGEVPFGKTSPIDEKVYDIGENVLIKSQDTTNLPEEYNGEKGLWKFDGWKLNGEDLVLPVIMAEGGLEFIGTWSFTPTYKVTHKFIGDTEDNPLPQEVISQLPNEITDKKRDDIVTPGKSKSDFTDVETTKGKWSFVNWDKENVIIVDKNEEFIGTWGFTEKKPVPKPLKPPIPELPKPVPKPEPDEIEEIAPIITHSNLVDLLTRNVSINEEKSINKQAQGPYMFGYPDGTFQPDRNMTRAEATAMFARLIKEYPTVYRSYNVNFLDIKEGDWYYESVEVMTEKNIIKGYEDGSFKPNALISRAEFITMASRFEQISSNNSKRFSDVEESHWAYIFIESAVAEGWVGGYPDGTFGPDKPITRAEVVTIINRILNRKIDKDKIIKNQGLLLNFKDLKASHWAYYDIMEATNKLENWIDK